MRLKHTLGFGLLALAQPSLAQQAQMPPPGGGPTAGQLMQHCLTGFANGTITDPVCTGYLAGFVGAIRISRTVSADFPICLPEQGISNTEIVFDISTYLEANADKLENSARSVAFLVLTTKFPCPKAGD